MNENIENHNKNPIKIGVITRIICGLVSTFFVISVGYFFSDLLDVLNHSVCASFFQAHAPVLIGFPILVALTTALVCGARALSFNSQINLLNFHAEGASSLIICWGFLFIIFTISLRALW